MHATLAALRTAWLLSRLPHPLSHTLATVVHAGIFERAGRDELADQVVKPLTKKFGSSCKVWARALERALTKGDSEVRSRRACTLVTTVPGAWSLQRRQQQPLANAVPSGACSACCVSSRTSCRSP